jgi:hypothetical protein
MYLVDFSSLHLTHSLPVSLNLTVYGVDVDTT